MQLVMMVLLSVNIKTENQVQVKKNVQKQKPVNPKCSCGKITHSRQ